MDFNMDIISNIDDTAHDFYHAIIKCFLPADPFLFDLVAVSFKYYSELAT